MIIIILPITVISLAESWVIVNLLFFLFTEKYSLKERRKRKYMRNILEYVEEKKKKWGEKKTKQIKVLQKKREVIEKWKKRTSALKAFSQVMIVYCFVYFEDLFPVYLLNRTWSDFFWYGKKWKTRKKWEKRRENSISKIRKIEISFNFIKEWKNYLLSGNEWDGNNNNDDDDDDGDGKKEIDGKDGIFIFKAFSHSYKHSKVLLSFTKY